MSTILEILVAEPPDAMDNLVEVFVEFGGEQMPVDPRSFLYRGRIRLTLHPSAPHVLRLLTLTPLSRAQSLVVDEQLVLDWAAGRLEPVVLSLLGELFIGLRKECVYGLAVEASSGSGSRIINVASSNVPPAIERLLRAAGAGLTVVLVDDG